MFKKHGDAAMSDALLLLKVEDLIAMCMGSPHYLLKTTYYVGQASHTVDRQTGEGHGSELDELSVARDRVVMAPDARDYPPLTLVTMRKNVVNFKLLQSVLHILARQMRLLEQAVDIRLTDGEYNIASDEDDISLGAEEPLAKSSGKKSKGGKEDRDRGREGERQGKGGSDKDRRQKESSTWKSTSKDKQARRDKDRADTETKDKDRGERYRDKGDKQRGEERGETQDKNKIERDRDKKETGRAEREKRDDKEEEKATFKERKEGGRSERGGKDEISGHGGRDEKVESGRKDDRGKGRSDKDRETSKGRDKTEGGSSEKDTEKYVSEKDRGRHKTRETAENVSGIDRSEKNKGRDKDRSEKDRERYVSGTTSERDKHTDRSEKDKRGDRDRDNDKSQKSRGRSEKDYERDREDDRRSEKSVSRSERDTERGKESSRGSDKHERERTEKDARKKSSGTSIAVSEREHKDQKILVVEKGPTTKKGDSTRVGSIEVVTLSQFNLLEQAVRSLEQKAAPLPPPTLPDNKKLRSDIAKGNASLTDTMQAMQISARVQAAEKAIECLTELTTEIAAKGGMPKDLIKKAAAIQSDVKVIVQEAKLAADRTETSSVAPSARLGEGQNQAGHPKAIESATLRATDSARTGVTLRTIEPPRAGPGTPRGAAAASSQLTSASRTASTAGTYGKFVTVPEMDDMLTLLRDELFVHMKDMTSRAQTTAENAALTAADLLKKLEIAERMNDRITVLSGVVKDYSEQLSGFDGGLNTQMSSFKQQMNEIHRELNDGLVQLAHVTNNAETAAVMELNEQYQGLDWELKETLHCHQNLTNYHGHLSDEMRSMVECVEMLREQKADREEVQDGLRDKADSSRLAGLLTEMEFDKERTAIDLRLNLCHCKFNKQEATWMQVMKDFSALMVNKAEYLQLLSIKEEAQRALQDLHARLQVLTRILGDPKTAMITRQLAKNGVCATCRVPAVMTLSDKAAGAPPQLPAARPPPAGAPAVPERELCVRDVCPYPIDEPPEGKSHMCQRWVGGSHTMLSNASRERPPPFQAPLAPVRRYVGIGSDSKPYKLAEDLLPCKECNTVTPEKIPGEADGPLQPSEVGAGDQVNVIKVTDARRVTIIDENKIRIIVDVDHNTSTASIGKADAKTSTSSMVDKANTTSISSTGGDRKVSSHQSEGGISTLTAYDDKPRRLTDIGNVVKGRITNVDENAIRRASIRYDTAVRRATIAEEYKEKSQRSDGEQDENEHEKV